MPRTFVKITSGINEFLVCAGPPNGNRIFVLPLPVHLTRRLSFVHSLICWSCMTSKRLMRARASFLRLAPGLEFSLSDLALYQFIGRRLRPRPTTKVLNKISRRVYLLFIWLARRSFMVLIFGISFMSFEQEIKYPKKYW